MKNPLMLLSLAAAAFLLPLTFSLPLAAQNLDGCGGVFLEASAAQSCAFFLTEDCTQKCEPAACEKVCASRLTETCSGDCTETAPVECTTSCGETCVSECTSQEEPPNCNGLCMSDCQQDCTAACADSGDQGQCRSSCAQVCSNECDEECDGEDETQCSPLCSTVCDGSCEGRANIVCQVSCQEELYTDCQDVAVEDCKEECETSGGAIFCDGQFIATGNDPAACAADLQDAFGVSVDVTAAASASADEKLADFFGCTGGAQPPVAALALLLALRAVAARKRDRRASAG